MMKVIVGGLTACLVAFTALLLLTLLGAFGPCSGASEHRTVLLVRLAFDGIVIVELLLPLVLLVGMVVA